MFQAEEVKNPKYLYLIRSKDRVDSESSAVSREMLWWTVSKSQFRNSSSSLLFFFFFEYVMRNFFRSHISLLIQPHIIIIIFSTFTVSLFASPKTLLDIFIFHVFSKYNSGFLARFYNIKKNFQYGRNHLRAEKIPSPRFYDLSKTLTGIDMWTSKVYYSVFNP